MGKSIIIENADFSANATENLINVTTVAMPEEGGVTSGGGVYFPNTQITITAESSEGYVFDKWSDGVTTKERTVVVGNTSDTYVAIFTQHKEDTTPIIWLDGTYGLNADGWKSRGSFSGTFDIRGTVGSNYLEINNTSSGLLNLGAICFSSPLRVGTGNISVVMAVDSNWTVDPSGASSSPDSIFLFGENKYDGAAVPGRWRFGLYPTSSKYLDVWCNDGTSTSNFCTSRTSPSAGKHIVGFTRNSNGVIKFYLDGALIYTSNYTKSFTTRSDTEVRIGTQGTLDERNYNCFTGKIYCAKAWTKILDDEAMATEFTALNDKYHLEING